MSKPRSKVHEIDVRSAGTYVEPKDVHKWLAASKQIDSDTKVVEDTQLWQ